MRKINYRDTLHSCYIGFIVQATIVNLAPVLFVIFQDKFGISFNMLSGLILTNFVSQFAIDAFSSKITDFFGYRKTMLAALSFSAIGLILLGVLPQIMSQKYLSLLIPTLIFSIGGGLLEVVVSPVVESLPLGDKKSTMALLHSFYCWGQLIVVLLSTLFIKFIGEDYWYFLPIIWAIIPMCNIAAFCIVPMTIPTQPKDRTKLLTLIKSPVFILSMLVMMMAGASEMVIAQWSSLFAEKGLQVTKFVGDLLGPCIFALLMGLGRLFYGVFGAKININKVLIASGCLCVACFLITALAPIPFLSLVGCGACGLAVSMMWPGTLSMDASYFPKGGTLLFGVAALCGDIGCTIGPSLAGFVADGIKSNASMQNWAVQIGLDIEQLSLRGGILVCSIFPIILLISIITLTILAKKKPLVNGGLEELYVDKEQQNSIEGLQFEKSDDSNCSTENCTTIER